MELASLIKKSFESAEVRVEMKGQIFSIYAEDKLLRGTLAEITPPPPCGWNPIEESGFGSEFYYRVKLADGQVFYRKYPDCPLWLLTYSEGYAGWELWLAVKKGKVVLLPVPADDWSYPYDDLSESEC
jgi:hypothetical protein